MILWKNGYFHTLEDETKTYHKLATNQGLIVGFDDDIKDLDFEKEIDLKGHHIYPGFVDSHLHLIGYGQKLSLVSLEKFNKKEALLNELKKQVALHQSFFEGYKPLDIDKYELNDIHSDGPIVLRHSDYHSVTVNDYVLDRIGIDSKTGFLTEDDAKLVIKSFHKQDKDMLKKMLVNSINKLHSYGITGGHSDDLYYFNGFHETLDIFNETLIKLPFRAHLLMHYMIIDDFIDSKLAFLDQNQYLQLGAVKIFYDGTFTSKTALLKHSYLHTNDQGMRMFEQNELIELVKKLRKQDLPLAIHVIGDLGLKELIDILEAYPPKKGLHDRIIHASLADLDTIKCMEKLPIILDVQPQFITSDLPQILDIFSKQPQFIYPLKTYLNHNITICGSSDAPVEDPNPFKGMHVAITRLLNNNQIFQEAERLTRYEALKLYTTYANIPTYKTNRGLLKKGYIADFTVTKDDLLKINLNQLLNQSVEMTIINEKIVYKR
ncbi:amidohydrolase [Mariniplasma anaerobium]|uniref:Amidohydrolase n=1 Tax=Mariniplasma anaerobium TaxID=2735436 RepID=A0A7U9XV78_9MOLU|nr:amidohydrolase [Mariniplasma anaerobium]BCR36331.1 amidohydrolase [Mariniplasma anaerobium]